MAAKDVVVAPEALLNWAEKYKIMYQIERTWSRNGTSWAHILLYNGKMGRTITYTSLSYPDVMPSVHYVILSIFSDWAWKLNKWQPDPPRMWHMGEWDEMEQVRIWMGPSAWAEFRAVAKILNEE